MEIFVWPLVVLILGIIGLFMFRKQISCLIDRTEKIGKEWLQTGKSGEQTTAPKTSAVDDFLKQVYDNELLREQENLIRNILESLKPSSATERENFLLRGFAATTLIQIFDRIYFQIYGSQIAALQYLNDSRNVTIVTSDIEPFFQGAVKTYPEAYTGDTFERWLVFLTSWGLARVDSGTITITVRGKEFLKYLVECGLSFVKSL